MYIIFIYKAGFHDNLVYLTVTACVEFFLPFISICSLNLAVYLNIRQRSQGLIRTKMPPVLRRLSVSLRRNNSKKHSTTELTPLPPVSAVTGPAAAEEKARINEEVSEKLVLDVIEKDTTGGSHSKNNNNNNNKESGEKVPLTSSRFGGSGVGKKDKNLKKDKKAARSLFILVFTFVVCWVSANLTSSCP